VSAHLVTGSTTYFSQRVVGLEPVSFVEVYETEEEKE
jgi:hypothetical protein